MTLLSKTTFHYNPSVFNVFILLRDPQIQIRSRRCDLKYQQSSMQCEPWRDSTGNVGNVMACLTFLCALKILRKVSGFFSAGLPWGGLLGAAANTLRPSSEKSRTSADRTHSHQAWPKHQLKATSWRCRNPLMTVIFVFMLWCFLL